MRLNSIPFYRNLIFFLSFVSGWATIAQEYSYRHYTVLDGLPQNQIISLFQDSRGYIWIATKGGVSRFDGHNFKNYSTNDGLLANHVIRIFEDKSGHVLFYTYLGLDRLERDTIVNVFMSDTILPDRKLLFVDHDKYVEWWIREDQQFKIYSGKEEWELMDVPNGLAGAQIYSIFRETAYNKTWMISSDHGIYSVGPKGAIPYEVTPETRITRVSKDELLASEQHYVCRIDTVLHKMVPTLNMESKLFTIRARGPDGKLYITYDIDHVLVVDGARASPLKKKFNYINALFVDREGNLWIATETGLYRRISTAFENFTAETGAPEYVWSIVEDSEGLIWCASYGNGLYTYDSNGFQRNDEYRQVYSTLSGDFFYTGARRFSDGSINFPVREQGILRYDKNQFSILEGLPKGSAMDVMEDTLNKAIVVASTAGAVIWKSGNSMKTMVSGSYGGRKFIKTLAMDKLGRYWLGGEYLLFVSDGEELTSYPNVQSGYNAGAVSIHADARKNIWLGTTSGLYLYDYNSFRRVAPNKIGSQVSSFAESEKGMLYMGVSDGLAILDLNDFYERDEVSMELLTAADGFLGFDCIRNGILKDREDNIWVAASERMVKFYPDRFFPDTIDPLIYIERLAVEGDGRRLQEYPDEKTESVAFSWPFDMNNVRIDFHSVHFRVPEQISFRYRLRGLSPNWSEMTKERFVSYTNLAPGDYTFEVLASNSDGVWSSRPARASFKIVPAFWQTMTYKIAANALAIVFILLAGYFVLNYFRKRKEAREETERQISELQLKTIRSQMDPHFTFNALNTISSVIYKENKEKAYRYFAKFSRLVRSSLEMSDKISRTLQEEIEFTQDYLDLEAIRFRDGFTYSVEMDRAVDHTWQVPKMIIQNYVENAVKHGLKHKLKDRNLWIKIHEEDGFLNITIEDNGVGRKAAEKKKGFSTGKGLKIMGDIFDLYHKLYGVRISQVIEDLTDGKGKPAGTRVRILMPAGRK